MVIPKSFCIILQGHVKREFREIAGINSGTMSQG